MVTLHVRPGRHAGSLLDLGAALGAELRACCQGLAALGAELLTRGRRRAVARGPAAAGRLLGRLVRRRGVGAARVFFGLTRRGGGRAGAALILLGALALPGKDLLVD